MRRRKNYNKRASKELIVDLLCVDSIFFLFFSGSISRYQHIRFCRQTRIGRMLLSLTPIAISKKFSQVVEPFNEYTVKTKNLGVIREEQLASLMRKSALKCAPVLSQALKVPECKLRDSYSAHVWNAYFHPLEAILRSDVLGSDVLCARVLPFPESICGSVRVYRRWIDFSRVIVRQNYRLDNYYDVANQWRAILILTCMYFISVVMWIWSCVRALPKTPQKEIAVQVTRRRLDRTEKNDLFWMNDDQLIDQTLLLIDSENRFSRECESMARIGTSLRTFLTGNTSCFLLKGDSCIRFMSTVPTFVKIVYLACIQFELRVILNGLVKALIYKTILESASVKVLVSNQSFDNLAPLLACSMTGVVYVRGTWSNQTSPHPHISTSADVFFAWGDVTVDTYSRSGARGTTFVTAGFIDGALLDIKDELSLPVKLAKNDRTVVLGFFDNLSSHDHPNSVQDLRKCVQMLCSLLRNHENLVVIYKPKTGDWSELRRTNSLTELAPFIETLRFITLFGEKASSHRPSAVAPMMDIVLGFPISSAATETAIVGVPSFHINLSGSRDHLWEQNGNNNLVFHDVDSAMAVLREYIEVPMRLLTYDREYVKGVNHFLDSMSSDRMQLYIEALCKGENHSVADRIKQANGVYREVHARIDGRVISRVC